MNPSRLLRTFVFMFSLLGIGSFAWGERYETVFIYTDDTAEMDNTTARAYLQSNACVSTNSLNLQEGEVAYVFNSAATSKPSGTISLTKATNQAFVHGLTIDMPGLDSNLTRSTWNYSWSNNAAISNYAYQYPIVGPAIARVLIKPSSARSGGSSLDSSHWSQYATGTYQGRTDVTTWDFKASEGYVTFRIVGSEQAPSKKFATVIPENASTNIRVVLEQSTDLINWTTAAPGVFPPSTAKRFFRVRSEEE